MLLRRPHRQRPAGVLVEMAFVGMFCFFLMFAIYEYGRYVFARQVMQNAARAGGRVAVVTPTSYLSASAANSAVNTAVTTAMAGIPVQNFGWTAYQADTSGNNIGSWTNTPFGNNLVVQLDADLPIMFPLFKFLTGSTASSLHITVKCMMRSEAN
jgi:Flp pilus assembly protein TadG